MAKTPAEELDVDGVAVRLSNPDKVYFPQLGEDGAKRRLVEYYRAVALDGAIMRALGERPTHLQRFPDGIDGEEVYQKRVPKYAPDYIRTCEVTFPSGRRADVLRVDHPASVVWAAQQGTVTFHPWHARCADPDHPDELRIDLDPQPAAGFDQARRVALDVVRPLLADLGFVGFPKTSGGRGIHIYIRIEPRWTFTQARRATVALAREIERRAAGSVTTSWWKEEREDTQIFIDYNQMLRDRTIASAYSVRRTARATVSTPVTWDELDAAHPDDFTIATVPERLRGFREGGGADPMAALDDVVHSIEGLLEQADRDEAAGLPELPYPPNYPKMPGEPKRVQPSRSRPDTVGNPAAVDPG
jgi:DNA ligase D-like protein (predicted polymerase)